MAICPECGKERPEERMFSEGGVFMCEACFDYDSSPSLDVVLDGAFYAEVRRADD
jgi:hypothetical protein